MRLPWTVTNHHPVVSDRAYNRFLRYPAMRKLEGPMAENAAWAREWFRENARPWCVAVPASEEMAGRVAGQFPGGERFAIVAASAGPEVDTEIDARWADDEPDRYFFLHSFASAVVEALLLEASAAVGGGRHRSPGHRGWAIEDNRLLFDALRRAKALPGPLEVLPSGMLTPRKSQLGVCALQVREACTH